MRAPACLMLIGIVSFIGACTPLYVSPAINAPLFGKEGEIHIAGQVEATTSSLDFNLAFSPIKHLGVLGGVSYSPQGDDNHRHDYGEFAVGYFLPFGHGRFETFGGAGYGHAAGDIKPSNDVDQILGSGDYARFFLQIDIGFSLDFLELGGSMGLAHVTQWHTAADDGVRRTVQEFFVEPGAFIRAGWKPIKFELQMQFIVPMPPVATIRTTVFQIALGLHLTFDIYGSYD